MVQKNEDYLSYINKMDENEILPDVPKILNYLTEKKQGVALGSASKNAIAILKRVKLTDKFQAIIDGNNVTKGKPNPEVFLKASEKLAINPENCIVFEDAIAGIQAANSANMITIGIGDKNILNEADFVFNDFTQISTDFIKELIKKE
jgi:beta-phosphoglucomutase